MESDAVYFSRRARQERAAAMKAAHIAAREAHLEMARRYDEFASALVPGPAPVQELPAA